MTARIFPFLLFFCLAFSALPAQKSASSSSKKEFVVEVLITGECAFDSLRLYAWAGFAVEEIDRAPLTKDKNGSVFKFRLAQTPSPGMYYLGKDLSMFKHVVIDGKDKSLRFTGKDCLQLTQWVCDNSPVNQAYDAVMLQVRTNNDAYAAQVQEHQNFQKNMEKLKTIKAEMAAIDARKKALLDSVRRVQPFLAKLVSMNTYYSYLNNNAGNQSEGEYFAEQFFASADMTDTVHRRSPYFFEALQGYAANLTKVGLSQSQQERYIEAMLARLPGEQHPNYQPMLLALSFGALGNNDALFIKYGKLYLEKFQGGNAGIDNFIVQRLAQLRGPTTPGEIAPNIREQKPDGNYMELKDLRGKYVLIDFWASWCGPCRQENPNVVRLYNKYKDKGFDVFGVSLDRNKEAWVAAIEKDQLAWHHVSDLQQWSSAPAKLYGVSSIPFTVLIDKEGRVIGTKLRGAALEEKLKEIFGE